MVQPAVGGFSLHLEMRDASGPAVLAVRGEVDATSAAELETAMVRLLDSATPIVIDLSAVPFIDSSGLNAVVRVLRSRKGAVVALAGATPAIARMIEIRGLDRMVAVHECVASAVNAMLPRPAQPTP